MKLLPACEDDARKAAGLFASGGGNRSSQQSKRKAIMSQDVFGKVHKTECKGVGLASTAKRLGKQVKSSISDKAARLMKKLKR